MIMLLPDTEPVDLHLDGPYSPEATLYAAAMVAELVRYLNFATRHYEALEYPAEAAGVVWEVSSAADRLLQLLGQVGGWAAAELAAGGIEVTHGEYTGRPDAAVMAFQVRLDRAREAFAEAADWLDRAASVAGTMAAADTGEGGSDG